MSNIKKSIAFLKILL